MGLGILRALRSIDNPDGPFSAPGAGMSSPVIVSGIAATPRFRSFEYS